ncbi:hypothetical protein BIY20_00335 [Vibrio panuliri]|uniref:Uncharacterized protein n=1 Tax=Vibrio panuliri TaxID=1381081 RepID=A0ABX3FKN6_9VIBR|nr:hypothetical protein BIY20_00335 [Vibrio panuliri]
MKIRFPARAYVRHGMTNSGQFKEQERTKPPNNCHSREGGTTESGTSLSPMKIRFPARACARHGMTNSGQFKEQKRTKPPQQLSFSRGRDDRVGNLAFTLENKIPCSRLRAPWNDK